MGDPVHFFCTTFMMYHTLGGVRDFDEGCSKRARCDAIFFFDYNYNTQKIHYSSLELHDYPFFQLRALSAMCKWERLSPAATSRQGRMPAGEQAYVPANGVLTNVGMALCRTNDTSGRTWRPRQEGARLVPRGTAHTQPSPTGEWLGRTAAREVER